MTVELRLVRLAGLAVVASAALALADRWGALRLDRSLFLAALCALAAAALLATARTSESLYGGLVARLAPRRGVPCWAARALVLVLAPVAGAGAVLYALGGLVEALARRPQPLPAMDWRRTAATGLLGVAVLLLARRAGGVIGSEALIWSVCLVASGLSLLWATAGVRVAGGRDPLEDTTVRVQIAVGLILAGVASVLVYTGLFHQAERTVVGAAIALAVLLLVVGPRFVRTSRLLAFERVARVRAQERAAMADHLHDSVLQTLALVQRRAQDPVEVASLARAQERELRAWLRGRPEMERPEGLAAALRAAAAAVEDTFRVHVDVVTVGDRTLDQRIEALVAAAREALVNAAKHAEGAPVSLFAEAEDGQLAVFVRDRGPGFDLDQVPADRRGVRESIIGRMTRHGGHARIRTAPGEGCEVALTLEEQPR